MVASTSKRSAKPNCTSPGGCPRPGIDSVPISNRVRLCDQAIAAYSQAGSPGPVSSTTAPASINASAIAHDSQLSGPKPVMPRGRGTSVRSAAPSSCSVIEACPAAWLRRCCSWCHWRRSASTTIQRGEGASSVALAAKVSPLGSTRACSRWPANACRVASLLRSSSMLPASPRCQLSGQWGSAASILSHSNKAAAPTSPSNSRLRARSTGARARCLRRSTRASSTQLSSR